MIWCAVEAHHIEQFPESRPSLLRYSPALVLVVVAITDIQRWADPDLWGHVAFGRAMLATHRLAFHDPYSYSAPGHLWLNHEWLSEALMGAFYDLGGVIGLKLMKFGCCVALVVFLVRGLAEIDSPMTLQFGMLELQRHRRINFGQSPHQKNYQCHAASKLHQLQADDTAEIVERAHQRLAQPFVIEPQMPGRRIRIR